MGPRPCFFCKMWASTNSLLWWGQAIVWIPKLAHIQTQLIFKLFILIYWLRHFIISNFFCNSYFWNFLQSNTFHLEFIFKPYHSVSLISLFYLSLIMIWYTIFHFYGIIFVYIAHVLMNYIIKALNGNKQHQWSVVILMMIQHIPCKQAPVCHVAVESNPYFSYAIVFLHCINTVMTRVVFRPFRLIHSFDRNGFLHVLLIIKIIQLPLSAFLWCMQIHVQNGSKQWAQ